LKNSAGNRAGFSIPQFLFCFYFFYFAFFCFHFFYFAFIPSFILLPFYLLFYFRFMFLLLLMKHRLISFVASRPLFFSAGKRVSGKGETGFAFQ